MPFIHAPKQSPYTPYQEPSRSIHSPPLQVPLQTTPFHPNLIPTSTHLNTYPAHHHPPTPTMTNYQNPHPTPIMKAYRKLDHKVRSQFGFHLLPPSSSTLLKRRRAPHVSTLIAATKDRAQNQNPSAGSKPGIAMPMPPKARLRGDPLWMKTPTQVSRQLPRSKGAGTSAAPTQTTAHKGTRPKGIKDSKREAVERYRAELATHHASQAPSRAEQEKALARLVREQALPGAMERARRKRVEEEGDSYFCFA
ncbi:hypothetical protein G7Y79_00010g028880 [Physcia stellaris]|nr:hypothetical protein G7Y79_00010g028880 [Physcia stellaris]